MVGMAMMSDISVSMEREELGNQGWLCAYDLNEVQGSIQVNVMLTFTNDQYRLELWFAKYNLYLNLSNHDCTRPNLSLMMWSETLKDGHNGNSK